MVDEYAQPPAISNRSQEFGSGMIGGQVAPPDSLQQEAARYNASVPRNYRPSGSGMLLWLRNWLGRRHLELLLRHL